MLVSHEEVFRKNTFFSAHIKRPEEDWAAWRVMAAVIVTVPNDSHLSFRLPPVCHPAPLLKKGESLSNDGPNIAKTNNLYGACASSG
jgi:hypothetical protein